MLMCKACLVRDVSRIISSVQTWCPVPPLAQASANPRQGAPKPPYPEGSWPSPPAHGIPQLPYGTSPRRFGARVSSAVLSPFIYMGTELSVGTAPSYPAKRVSRLAVPKKIIGSYIIAADRLMRSAPDSTVPRRAYESSSCLASLPVALTPLRCPWLEPE
jgi:hypothetical protein